MGELESSMESPEHVKKTHYVVYEEFTELDKPTFKKLVKPLIKAFYKHEHGEFITIHIKEVEIDYEIYLQVYVDRKSAKLEFSLNPYEWDDVLCCELNFDGQDITPKNIFNFLYYEYHGLFFDYHEQKYFTDKTKTEKKQSKKLYL